MLSSFLLVAVALPLGFAHTPVVITKYVTVCEPSYTNGYTFPAPSASYGGGYDETSPAADYTGAPGSGGYGSGGSSGYGSGGSPGYGGGNGVSSSTCTDEEGGGYGSGGNGGYNTQTGPYGSGGSHSSKTGSGHASSYTHSFSNHSSTSFTSGTGKPTSTKATSKPSSTKTTSAYVPGCTNTADDRAAWCNGFSIDTDEQQTWPTTGKIRTYTLEITNTTMSPDGFERLVLAVNNQYPGPVIEADWGDTLQITVKNSLQNNGTSMHWHGLRQLNTCNMDGTNGVTECPIAPGQSKVYTFVATEHGTSWYHSHYSSQYGDGVVGPIVIHGPATANYDEDLGAYPITEWYHTTVYQNALYSTYNGGSSPIADNGLINGLMVAPTGVGLTGGSYSTTSVTKGKSYRLRIINTSVDNHFKVSLDSHKFTVLTSDFVPIVPYETEWLFLAIGQRYDVVIAADQAVDNYWFRAEVMGSCSATNNNNGNIKAIFTYDGAGDADPKSTEYSFEDSCDDETTLVPHVAKDVPSTTFDAVGELAVDLSSGTDTTGSNVIFWTINGQPINVDWETPTLQYVANSETTYPDNLNIMKMPTRGQWYYWVIQASDGIPSSHPIHLHGHDFALLGTGANTFDASQLSSLNFKNPTRRDVAMLPRSGWLVIAFEADNPGAWLMHCHVAWHVSQGFAAQFLEIESEISTTMNLASLGGEGGCDGWKTYQDSKVYEDHPKDDSGLRKMRM